MAFIDTDSHGSCSAQQLTDRHYLDVIDVVAAANDDGHKNQ